MKPLAALAAGPDLVAVLEKELGETVASGAAPVDPETWDKALTGLAREILSRPGKQFRARLLLQAWELAGGPGDPPPLLPHVVELLHAGSLIVDDIEDDSASRRGAPALHRLYGVPRALNTGNWLYFAAFHLIERCGLDDAVVLDLYRRLSITMFRCHQGQALDLGLDVTEVRRREVDGLARSIAALKTGSLMQLAAEVGAVAAGADAARVAALGDFGAALGVALQHLDDLGGVRSPHRAHKGLEDLACGRVTWPWAYLSGALDEVGYAHLQSDLRQARQRGDCAPFLATLRGHLGDAALAAAGRELAAARAVLERWFPDHPALEAVAAELGRLERSYV